MNVILIAMGDIVIELSMEKAANRKSSSTSSIYEPVISSWAIRMGYFFPWWRHQMETFSALLATDHRWRGALVFSLICTWTNGWANNRDAGNLRRHRAHYDAIVMFVQFHWGDPTVLDVIVTVKKCHEVFKNGATVSVGSIYDDNHHQVSAVKICKCPRLGATFVGAIQQPVDRHVNSVMNDQRVLWISIMTAP